MKKIFALTSLLLLFSVSQIFAVTIADDTVSGVNRYAVYVGCNNGGKGREKLLYAGSDAQSFKVAMAEIGGVTEDNSRILIDPTKDSIEKAFADISKSIQENSNNSKRSEFIFYYSGHSDENSLLLGESKYDYSTLKAAITAVPSDIHVVILDSCYSGNFIRTKGGQKRKPFLIDDSSVVTGHAYLSSSSDNESSQESDEIESSYFTNAMITGLRGAADTSGDNKVTLNELYSYAFNDTLSKTESSKAGPQHPNYNITLVGSGDLILSDLTTAESMLSLSKDAKGRFIIRDANDKLISEINKVQGQPIFMALPSGQYSALIIDEYSTKQGTFLLEKDQVYVLDQNSLSSIKRKTNRLRGDEVEEKKEETVAAKEDDEEFLSLDDLEETKESKKIVDIPLVEEESEDLGTEDLENFTKKNEESEEKRSTERFVGVLDLDNPFKLMLTPGLTFVGDEDKDAAFTVGLIGSVVNNNEMIQVSDIFSISSGNIYGAQIANGINIAKGQVNGVQVAGIFNMGNDVEGAQVGGIFNLARFMNGAQVGGVASIAKHIDGGQISGVISIAKEINGAQISGLANVANTVNGAQIGIVNYSRECEGATIGLFNYVGNGLHDICVAFDTDDCVSVYWQGGSKGLFTTYGVTRPRNTFFENSNFGCFFLGLGTEITFPKTSLDLEFLWKFVYNESTAEKFSELEKKFSAKKLEEKIADCSIPSIRVSWNMFESKFIRLYLGTTFDINSKGWNDYAFEVYKKTWVIDMDETRISPSFSFGCKVKI